MMALERECGDYEEGQVWIGHRGISYRRTDLDTRFSTCRTAHRLNCVEQVADVPAKALRG
jgi:hypothetical protein